MKDTHSQNTSSRSVASDKRGKDLSDIRPVFLFWLTIAVLAIPNIALCITERMTPTAAVTNVLLPVAIVWLLMTLSRRPGKTTWLLFPLIFFAAFQLVLLYLFGHSIIAVDMFLNIVTTNPNEAIELLDNLLPAIALVVVLYVSPLIIAIISLRKKDLLHSKFIMRQRRMALFAVVAGTASLGLSYAADREYSAKIQLYPLNVGYNLELAVERSKATANYAETSAAFKFNAKATHPDESREVYVMVIGETARACNFSLYGYGRRTTPLLEHTRGLVAFTNVLTQSNTTHKSVPMLMSAASAENYNRIYQEKGIITAFKEAGFHTIFISNQRPNRSFIDFFGKEADEWVFIKEKLDRKANVPDSNMLPMIKNVLAKGRKKELIVLHTYGSHFNYRERYTAAHAMFKPDDASEAKFSNRASLVNAYDNSILSTDSFLHGVITLLDHSGATAAMIYTSDHGENIFDDRRRLFLHASPVPSYYELHVPFIIWTSDAYRHAYTQESSALLANQHKSASNSKSTFHTMLGLAGIETPYRNDSLSLASRRFIPTDRIYLNDHNKPVPVNKILRAKEDFIMMDKINTKQPGNPSR
jgi:glucan phosphoethanolaminetransferase (alkaline phosphatase superfamily)